MTGVARARHQAPEAKAAQHVADAALRQCYPEPGLNGARQVRSAPADHAVLGQVRALPHPLSHLGFLLISSGVLLSGLTRAVNHLGHPLLFVSELCSCLRPRSGNHWAPWIGSPAYSGVSVVMRPACSTCRASSKVFCA